MGTLCCADRAGWSAIAAAERLRGRPDRRRIAVQDVPAHHVAVAAADHRHRNHPAQCRSPALLRHHLHHHAGRSRQCLEHPQHLWIPRRLRVFQHRLCVGVDADTQRDRVRRGAGIQSPARRGRVVRNAMTDAHMSDRSIRILNTVQLMIAGVIIMAPVVWMLLSSFKPSFEVTAYPPTLIFSPTTENYRHLLQTTPFFSYAVNSLIVTIGSAGLGLLFGIPAAFAVSWTRISWPAILTLAARMAPGTLFLLPWYVMFRQLGLIGSYTALILSHAVITLPIVIWVLLPSFDNIPRSVFEAAQVDGCGVTRILWRIALPLVGSGIAVAAILAFVFSWNYFLFSLVLSNGDTKTLIAAAFNFVGEGSTEWGALMAAATLIALPPLVLATLVQRWLVAGLTLGAVKG